MYRNPKLWAVLGAIAVAIAVFAPGALGTALPLLIIAICPLSMLLMARTMAPASRSEDKTVQQPQR